MELNECRRHGRKKPGCALAEQTRGSVATLLISTDNTVKFVIVAISGSKIIVSKSAEVHNKGANQPFRLPLQPGSSDHHLDSTDCDRSR